MVRPNILRIGGILSLLGLLACAETKRTQLRFSPSGSQPGLVLAFRLDELGSELLLHANFNTNDPALNYQADTLAGLLEECSEGLGQVPAGSFGSSAGSRSQCVQLGTHIGQVLFQGSSFVFNPNSRVANVNRDLDLQASTRYVFVLFIYNPDDLGAGENRCFQLKTAIRSGDRYEIDGTAASSFSITLPSPSISPLDQRNCFSLL